MTIKINEILNSSEKFTMTSGLIGIDLLCVIGKGSPRLEEKVIT